LGTGAVSKMFSFDRKSVPCILTDEHEKDPYRNGFKNAVACTKWT
jgi:hypothetical protein